jgi:hypothetical protein
MFHTSWNWIETIFPWFMLGAMIIIDFFIVNPELPTDPAQYNPPFPKKNPLKMEH